MSEHDDDDDDDDRADDNEPTAAADRAEPAPARPPRVVQRRGSRRTSSAEPAPTPSPAPEPVPRTRSSVQRADHDADASVPVIPPEADDVREPAPDGEEATLALGRILRCPVCQATRLELAHGAATCLGCGRSFEYRDRVVDLVGDRVVPPNPAQRLMQLGLYSTVYERFARPAFTRAMAGRDLELELGLAVDMLALHELGHRPLVLDVACGPGLFARRFAAVMEDSALAPLPGTVVGVDLSRPMLREASQQARQAGHENLWFVRGDALSMPFRSGTFDRVHCAAALHLIDDPGRALSEMVRVLRPGGEAVVSTFVNSQLPAVHLGQRLAGRLTGMRLFDPAELHKRVKRAGFSIVGEARQRYAVTLRLRR